MAESCAWPRPPSPSTRPGRHIQAGLYPNPDLALNWDEIGDRTGHGGIVTLPKLSQTFVTGRKLSLAQAVVAAEVDQATLSLMNERYAVIAGVLALRSTMLHARTAN